MKHAKNFEQGDIVRIIRTHGNDMGMTGIIIERRCSFCKIQLLNEDGSNVLNPQNNKPVIVNHTYGQFEKVQK